MTDKISTDEIKTVLEAKIAELRAALREAIPCSVCGEPAFWEWMDEDGSEIVCDKHKRNHFYRTGPTPINNLARAALERSNEI